MLTPLRRVTVAAAFPYGFTLAIWGSSTVAANALGRPTTAEVLLFIAGAVVGFVGLEVIAHRGWRANRADPFAPAIWVHAHVLSAGGAVLAVAGIAELPLGVVRWSLAGLTAAATYLLITAAAVAVADHRDADRR